MNIHSSNIIPIKEAKADWSEKHEIGARQAHMLERAMELLVENYRVTERHLFIDGQQDAALKVAVKLREAQTLLKQVADCHSIRIIPDEDQ